MENISSFKTLFEKAAYGSNSAKVFEDFLTKIIEPHKTNNTPNFFYELMAELIIYMENNSDNPKSTDLLGEFFQQEITHCTHGQFFTPFHITDIMAQMVKGEEKRSLNVLDPVCGSGLLLMELGRQSVISHNYYGIDADSHCVRMSAVNFLFNGLPGEVICANSLSIDDISFGYKISFIPLRILKIKRKEDSFIWQMNQATFLNLKKEKPRGDTSPKLWLF